MEIAKSAGFDRVAVHPEHEHLIVPLSLPNGRHQNVYVQVKGQTPRGDAMLTFFSPCREVDEESFLTSETELAWNLLRKNEEISFGRFAIWRHEDHYMLMVSCDHIERTMDPEEFEAMVKYVGVIADEFEESTGEDKF